MGKLMWSSQGIKMISLKNIIKYYDKKPVLNNLSLEVDEGEIVSIMGKSGSGKSTILNIISGIEKPESGDIIIRGQFFGNMNDSQKTLFRRMHIGFIFQFFNLLQNLTIYDNIKITQLLNNVNDDEYISYIMDFLEIKNKSTQFPHQLSGGEQQRVAIARALAHKPEIILADEPTGSLDEDSGKKVMGILLILNKKFNKTVVMVTHDIDVASYGSRIVKIHDGQVSFE